MKKMKMGIVGLLKGDVELQQFRQEWKEKFTQPFPPWNYDCFGGIDDYKQRIKCALEAGDSKKICETCTDKVCQRKFRLT